MRRHYDPIEVRLGPPHGRMIRARHANSRATVQARPANSRVAHPGGMAPALGLTPDLDLDDDLDCERADDRGPGQFIWRGRIWRVLEVESRWRESGSWWTGPAVRAARGEIGTPDEDHDLCEVDLDPLNRGEDPSRDPGGDVLCEVEVWRVEAANGRQGSRGIYDLAHSLWSGEWHLRGVFD